MSLIGQLGKNNVNLPDIMSRYDDDLKDAEVNLSLKGKMLDVAIKEQSAWPIYYDLRRAELKTLVKYFNAQVSKVRSTRFRQYENYSRVLSERITNTYIDNEKEYLDAYELLLEVEELYEMYAAVVEAFNKRGFALRDLTQCRIHSIETSTL